MSTASVGGSGIPGTARTRSTITASFWTPRRRCESADLWRIRAVPRASALGSGAGCQPFGWGAGFCAFSDLNDLARARADDLGPARPSAHGPSHAIGYTEQGLIRSRRCSNTRRGSRFRSRWIVRSSPDAASLDAGIKSRRVADNCCQRHAFVTRRTRRSQRSRFTQELPLTTTQATPTAASTTELLDTQARDRPCDDELLDLAGASKIVWLTVQVFWV